jgi:hypothetical protein
MAPIESVSTRVDVVVALSVTALSVIGFPPGSKNPNVFRSPLSGQHDKIPPPNKSPNEAAQPG